MPILAGDVIPASVLAGLRSRDSQVASYTATITSYGTSAASGTYADCAVIWTWPDSGWVRLDWRAQLVSSTTGNVFVSPQVRDGATIGSGTIILGSTTNELDDNALLVTGTSAMNVPQWVDVQGTPGAVAHARLLHRVNTGTGTIQRRRLMVTNLPE